MRPYWPAMRLIGGLISLCVCVVFVANALGVVPERDAAVDGRLAILLSVLCFSTCFVLQRLAFHSPSAASGTEAVIVLDKDERIARANDAFGELVGLTPAQLIGRKVGDLTFLCDVEPLDETDSSDVPVSSPHVLGDDGAQRGGSAAYDNLSNLERKHAQLRKVLERLRVSRKVVRRQNQELKALATRDPLTGCFNRRTLFHEFEKLWEASKRFNKPLSCVMVDVDHFKSVNDRFGHQVGDAVLKGVAEMLRKTARKADIVCRYGGEEFCILLPHVGIEEAEHAAERFRVALTAKAFRDVPVTASFGVSSWTLGATHPQEMMDQADKALYAAKRSGRNKVMRYDLAPKELLEGAKTDSRPFPPAATTAARTADQIAIPFQAVSGLLAALGYRHAETAEHCRRVADLCVSVAGGLMSQKDAYVMEMAALLHDIGKLGVPDNVLLKAGPLSAEEWKTIRTHEGIGVEIIRAAFTSDELADLVRLQHCWYGGTPTDPTLPRGPKIPLPARLLAVANAYDSMTTDHPYRKAIGHEAAVAELRRCSVTQFDPLVVEHFIKTIGDLNGKKERVESLGLSKQSALKIGVQIEKLALAADVQDLGSLVSMASQLRTMAQESGIATIADAAAKLEQSAATNSNQMDLMELTIDLLEMCRQTQRALLPAIPRTEKAKRARPKSSESIDLKLPDPKRTPIALLRPPQYRKALETPKPRPPM